RFGLALPAPERIGDHHCLRRAVRANKDRRDVRHALLGVLLARGSSAKTADAHGLVIVEETLHCGLPKRSINDLSVLLRSARPMVAPFRRLIIPLRLPSPMPPRPVSR